MTILNYIILFLLIAVPTWATETLVFKTQIKAEQITNSAELGSVQGDDLGVVKLIARKDGNRISIQAVQSDGAVVGKAETVVGLTETPLYVMTPKGLRQLTIRWKTE